MRIHVLPLMFGFVLLGALTHSVVLQVDGPRAAAAPLPAPKVNMPKQLRTSGSDTDSDLHAVLPHAAGVRPLPAFNSAEDRDVCAAEAAAPGGRYICTWAI